MTNFFLQGSLPGFYGRISAMRDWIDEQLTHAEFCAGGPNASTDMLKGFKRGRKRGGNKRTIQIRKR